MSDSQYVLDKNDSKYARNKKIADASDHLFCCSFCGNLYHTECDCDGPFYD
jgi:hypothetical protein